MSAYSAAVLADSPALYWRLGSGGITDQSGNARNGTAQGGVTIGGASGALGASGDTDAATDFDGADDYVSSAYNPFAGTRSFEVWANRDTSSTIDVFFSGSVGGASGVFGYLEAGGNDVKLTLNGFGTTAAWPGAWPGNGQWAHLVFNVVAGTNAELFVNGVSKGTQTISAYGSPGNLRVSHDGALGGFAGSFDGKLDEFAVYTSALSAARVVDHYNAAQAPATAASPRPRERPPLGLYVKAITPSGREYRWGSDERRAANVPSGIVLRDQMPGGYDGFDCVLPRLARIDYRDLQRFTTLKAIGVGGMRAGEARLNSAPRISGDQMSVSPSASGWLAHTEDDESAVEVFVDRDLSRWGAMSSGRRAALLGIPRQPFDPETHSDSSGVATMALTLTGPIPAGQSGGAEAWYDAGPGALVGSVYYDLQQRGGMDFTVANWTWTFLEGPTDSTTSGGSGDLSTAANVTGTFALGTPRRYVMLEALFNVAGLTAGAQYVLDARRLAVFGSQGLTKQGSTPDQGYLASDIVAHALGKYAPLLQFTTGTDGTITTSSFVIPQAAFREPTTVAEIIRQVLRFDLPDYAVWDDRTFYMHPRGARGKRWRARASEAKLTETGPTTERLFNGVLVQYQDVDGTTRLVGPPGSNAETTSSTLLDTDEANPANQLGVRRWHLLQMRGLSTAAGATQVGQVFLSEAAQLDSSGSAQLVGYAEDDKGVIWPAHQVKSGDTISFSGTSDSSYRRIVRKTYDDDSRTATIDIDAPPDSLDALLERLDAVLVPLGL